ncbi:MAG: YicC/YloC family endoribonuclease [Acutalibacteraceae bacterium]|nr:YicC/YloC family endoribonuclease [Acutalibacteraceae bacterium]
MANSMTGYGRAQVQSEAFDITAEIKAVNHRYFELSVKVPRGYSFLEEKISSFLKKKISRGKIEVYVSIVNLGESDTVIEINNEYMDAYMNALKQLCADYNLQGDFPVMSFAQNPDVFKISKKQVDEEQVTDEVLAVLDIAVNNFISMRKLEGQRLCEDVVSRISTIENYVSFVEEKSPESVKLYRERLEAKIKEVIGDVQIDEQRILTEAAIFADKIAVAEETVRLRSHLKQVVELLGKDEPIGRKLDFIVQEMNREANTTGSKSQDIDITNAVVEIKAEIEKIREQIQNLE